jgi:hypothetical protein
MASLRCRSLEGAGITGVSYPFVVAMIAMDLLYGDYVSSS